MNITPGTYVRPIEAPDHWEVVQAVDDAGVFVGNNHHVPFAVLASYWEHQRRDSIEWERFPVTAETCLRQLVLLYEAAWMGRYKPLKIQAVIDEAILLAGLKKVETTPGDPPGYSLR